MLSEIRWLFVVWLEYSTCLSALDPENPLWFGLPMLDFQFASHISLKLVSFSSKHDEDIV